MLFACCTSGLVGGKSVKELSDDRDVARERGTVRLSLFRGSAYETSCRFEWYAADGNEVSQGTTGDVARKSEDETLSARVRPTLSSLKSPECSADRGRSISRPAAAWSRTYSVEDDVCEGCNSAEGARSVFGQSRSPVMSLWEVGQQTVVADGHGDNVLLG